MRAVEIVFVPNYLKNQIIKNVPLSKYDHDDVYYLTTDMLSVLTTMRLPEQIDQNRRSKLINLYYKPGKFVFSEGNVTMDGEKVFEITHVLPDSADAYPCDKFVIVCSAGSTNAIVDVSNRFRINVAKWLIGYMVKRLDQETLFNTMFFEDYWLNNK